MGNRYFFMKIKQESAEWYRKMVEEEAPGSCSESDLTEPWKVTDNLINGCVQYFVPGKKKL